MKHQDTEPIEGETWCTYCKVPVDEWVVSFEPNSEGYDKIRRCPNCNEKCFDDGKRGYSVLLFIVGCAIGLGGIAKWESWTGIEFEKGMGVIAGMAVMGFAYLFMVVGIDLYKRYARRLGPKK